MPGTRKKMRKEEENDSRVRDGLVDYIGSLPNELICRVLSYLSFEEIDRLKVVNRKFKDACTGILKIGYRKAKKEVALCNKRASINLRNSYVGGSNFKFQYYIDKIFWFVVNEFLTDSFCLFGIRKGYKNKKYSVNAKTVDVVHKLLWFKETDDVLPMVIEMILGRSQYHYNMKCFEDCGVAYFNWLGERKYRGRMINKIRVPVFNKKQPGLCLPRYLMENKKEVYALVLDVLTTLWRKEINLKQHRLIGKPSHKRILNDDAKVIPVLKPGQNPDPQLYADSDTEAYEEIFPKPYNIWKDYTTNKMLDIMVSQGLPDVPASRESTFQLSSVIKKKQ